MAHPPKDIPWELSSKWLALRQKHQDDSDNFQRMVTKNRAEFEARVDAARKKLLATHISEERRFWSQHGQAAGTAKTAASSASTARMQTPSSGRSSVTASGKTATPTAKTTAPRPALPRIELQTPATSTKASQQPKTPQVPPAPKKPQRAPVQQQERYEVIDLCSDDEEDLSALSKEFAKKPDPPQPARKEPTVEKAIAQDSMDIDEISNSTSFSIPEASIELFGGAKHMPAPVRPHSPYVKDEEVRHSTPKPASPFVGRFTSTPRSFNGLPESDRASPFMHRATTATPQFGSSTPFNPPTTPNTPGYRAQNGGLDAATSPQQAGSVMPSSRQPSVFSGSSLFLGEPIPDNKVLGCNTSSTSFAQRLSSATPSASLFTFQSQPGSQSSTATFPVGRPESHPWANFGRLNQKQPEETSGRPPPSLASAKQPSAQFCEPQYPSGSFAALATSKQPFPVQQLPSPPPSHASVISESITPTRHNDSLPSSGFKKPCLPASAAPSNVVCPSVAPEARHVRAGTRDSRASSVTLPANPRGQRGGSIASRTSDISGRTGATQRRKRKFELSLSSDEDEDPESDYAPSEPDSPLAKEPARRASGVPVAKKSKVTPAPKAVPRVQKFMGKNGFGFKMKVIPKPKLGTATTSSSPASKTLTHKSTPVARDSPSARATSVRPSTEITKPKPKPKPVPALKKTLLEKKPIPQPSKRRAAVAAENKIQEFFDNAKEFETEYAIEEADHMETARLPEDMRRMSITPAPGFQQAPDNAESVHMLVDSSPERYHTPSASRAGSTAAPSKVPNTPKSPPGFDAWTQARKTGDRHNSTQRFQATIEDDDSEADISYDIRSDKRWQRS